MVERCYHSCARSGEDILSIELIACVQKIVMNQKYTSTSLSESKTRTAIHKGGEIRVISMPYMNFAVLWSYVEMLQESES